jgi:DNA-binding NarL/FixJ family response regulator
MTTMRNPSSRDRSQKAPDFAEVPYGLTQGEFNVLRLLTEGLYDHQISEALDLSESTIKNKVNAIVRKMNTRSRTEAGVRAIREGLFPRD